MGFEFAQTSSFPKERSIHRQKHVAFSLSEWLPDHNRTDPEPLPGRTVVTLAGFQQRLDVIGYAQ